MIRAGVEDGVSQTEVARTSGVGLSTIQRRTRAYREHGRSRVGEATTWRSREDEVVKLVEGFALRKPRRSMATIQRQVSAIALHQGWEEPRYPQVYRIVKAMEPALVTLAHEGGI